MATFPGFGRTFDFTMDAQRNNGLTFDPLFRQARLFCFPHDPKDVLPKVHEHPEFWMENFALPYPITAIEDQMGLTVIWDCDFIQGDDWKKKLAATIKGGEATPFHPMFAAQEPGRGCGLRRMVMDVVPSWSIESGAVSMEHSNQFMHMQALMEAKAGPFINISVGCVWVSKMDTEQFTMQGEVFCAWGLHRKSRIFSAAHDDDAYFRGLEKSFLLNARCAMEEVMWFSSPDRFVVEEQRETCERKQKRSRKGKPRRAHERPNYHSWTPLDMKHVRGHGSHAAEPGGKKRGHWRRGHYRTLRADRYARSGMQGKTILVRPAFIGDETFQVERSHYRVLLGHDDVLVGQQPEQETA